MKLKMIKRILSASVLISICMLTGCAGNVAASVQNGTLLSTIPAYDTGMVEDSSAAEIPGSVDWSVYEAYGLGLAPALLPIAAGSAFAVCGAFLLEMKIVLNSA